MEEAAAAKAAEEAAAAKAAEETAAAKAEKKRRPHRRPRKLHRIGQLMMLEEGPTGWK